MALLDKIVKMSLSPRMREIDEMADNSILLQNRERKRLMNILADTHYGKMYSAHKDMSYELFAKHLPVVEYEDIASYIERHRVGEDNVLTTEHIQWYAKSSGTTGSKSKFIPTPAAYLADCHYKGMRDVLAMLYRSYPELSIMGGKTLTLGGSHKIDEMTGAVGSYGDLSAILIQNAPTMSSWKRVPSKQLALLPDFEEKCMEICRTCVGENVTAIAGVPSWNLVMLNKVLEYTGKSTISEVWGDMEVFMHGGVSFAPYREEFNRIIGSPDMKYIENYNASEGFFAIQDDKSRDDMMLMLDYGIFYEFLPTKCLSDTTKAIPLEDVKCGENYAVIISTLSGLWRYMIGDTVMFTSIQPYRIKITGRTKLYINAFGEEVIIDNTDRAVLEASREACCEVSEYTVAPVFMDKGTKGRHQWVVEFRCEPDDMGLFIDVLDKTIQQLNSDYEAKRANDTTLLIPDIVVAPVGSFHQWLKTKGKTGGQNKVPRLSNNRTNIEELLTIIHQ